MTIMQTFGRASPATEKLTQKVRPTWALFLPPLAWGAWGGLTQRNVSRRKGAHCNLLNLLVHRAGMPVPRPPLPPLAKGGEN